MSKTPVHLEGGFCIGPLHVQLCTGLACLLRLCAGAPRLVPPLLTVHIIYCSFSIRQGGCLYLCNTRGAIKTKGYDHKCYWVRNDTNSRGRFLSGRRPCQHVRFTGGRARQDQSRPAISAEEAAMVQRHTEGRARERGSSAGEHSSMVLAHRGRAPYGSTATVVSQCSHATNQTICSPAAAAGAHAAEFETAKPNFAANAQRAAITWHSRLTWLTELGWFTWPTELCPLSTSPTDRGSRLPMAVPNANVAVWATVNEPSRNRPANWHLQRTGVHAFSQSQTFPSQFTRYPRHIARVGSSEHAPSKTLALSCWTGASAACR